MALTQRKVKKKRRGSEVREIQIPIPTELVMEEILPRLPVKSLMRFRCVSKLWSSHIKSRYFSNRFLAISSRPRPRNMQLVDHINYDEYVTRILALAPDTTGTTPSSFVVEDDPTIAPMIGYGMQKLHGFMWYTLQRKEAHIYNPATRQLVTLPAPTEGYKLAYYFLGHDPINDQYKMVCTTSLYSKEIRSEHWVFVLKPGRGSWKKLASEIRPHIPDIQGLFIDGVIYYAAWIRTGNHVIVSFHIMSEEFKIIQLPPNWLPITKRFCLIDYGGKVTIVDHTNLSEKGMFDLLVLEDATNEKRLKKSLVLQPSQLQLVNNFIFKVKCQAQNGKLLLVPQDFFSPFHVLCYDLQSNDLRKIEIKGIPDYWLSKFKAPKYFELMFMDQSESVIHLET